MAKKQRQQRTSSESSATVTGYQCATATAATAATGKDSATADNLSGELFSSQECFWDNVTGLPTFGPGFTDHSSFDRSFNTLPFVLSTTEFMHKQKTTQPEKDNKEQQPEATVADNLTVASSTAFPACWFERPYFANVASSNASNFALASSSSHGIGSGTLDIHQMVRGADGAEEGGVGRMHPQVTVPPRSHAAAAAAAAADSLWVNNSLTGSTNWRGGARNKMQGPSTSSTYQLSHEPSNKRRKKRPSGAAADVFTDSDGSDDDDDDDDDDGSLSDVEEDEGAMRANSQHFAAKFLELRSNGKPCNFWQYNSQARGPKGRRIYGEITLKDCHVLDEFSDPVTQGGSGKGQLNKLRHGEGNDPRPDTHKLMEIGSRISRLEEEFRRLSAAKSGNKDEVGRQKNKLASRICRLKKKAQHEANKVKLEGLREEHEKLVTVVARLVTIMDSHILRQQETTGATPLVGSQPSFCSQLESLMQSHLKFMIAGHTAEYVNMQLQKAAERFGSTSRTPA